MSIRKKIELKIIGPLAVSIHELLSVAKLKGKVDYFCIPKFECVLFHRQ